MHLLLGKLAQRHLEFRGRLAHIGRVQDGGNHRHALRAGGDLNLTNYLRPALFFVRDIVHQYRLGIGLILSIIVMGKIAWVIEITVFGRVIDAMIQSA